MACFIGLVVLAHNPNLNPDHLLTYVIDNYSFTGLKGCTLVAVMAMGMSTADSYINASAVIIANDLFKPLKVNFIQNYLLLSRLCAVCIGSSATILVLYSKDIFQLILLAGNFYTPIVTVPLMLAIFGFRSTTKSVLVGMSAGFITVIMWRVYIQPNINIDSIIPATFANLLGLLITHYMFKQPGGWVGIKDPRPLIILSLERKRKLNKFITSVKEFHLLDFLKNNLPKKETSYTIFSIFTMVCTYFSMYMISEEVRNQYRNVYNFMYHSVFIVSCIFLTYPIWPKKIKNVKFIAVTWHLGTLYILVCVGSILMIISNFSELQLMIFTLNLMAIGMLFNWQFGLVMIVFGLLLTLMSYQWYAVSNITDNMVKLYDLKIKIVYVLFMISGFLLTFLKPKQQHQEFTEEKNKYLWDMIGAKEKETQEALALKSEFIRNISHEYHAPMTGIISMAETLQEAYDTLTDEQKRNAIEIIIKSSRSLKAFDDNITTLARLSKPHYELKKEDLDFSSLVYDRIQICCKLYEVNKEDREFVLDIKEDLMANVDRTYMIQLLDNLIINSINYCKQGKIKITLSQDKNTIHLVISDTGIGIPKNELSEIFEPFTVSSRTKTPAGGRGIGLAICKRILEVHGGNIKAENNSEKGSSFVVMLPRDV